MQRATTYFTIEKIHLIKSSKTLLREKKLYFIKTNQLSLNSVNECVRKEQFADEKRRLFKKDDYIFQHIQFNVGSIVALCGIA